MNRKRVCEKELRDAVMNEFQGLSREENAEAIGITVRQLDYWRSLPLWQTWEELLRKEIARVSVESQRDRLVS